MNPFDPKQFQLPHPYIWWGLLGGPFNPAAYPMYVAYSCYVDWLKAIVSARDSGKSS
jgi:hypothetical protein